MNSRTVHFVVSAAVAAILAANVSGQSLLGPKPSAIQHVTVETQAVPKAAAGAAAHQIALQLDVTPKANIHVYAPGAKDFTAVSLVLTAPTGVTVGKPVYPAAHPAAAGEDDTPAYRKAFRITQPITVKTVPQDMVLTGVLNYQACDDRLCYPVASLPVSWTIHAQ